MDGYERAIPVAKWAARAQAQGQAPAQAQGSLGKWNMSLKKADILLQTGMDQQNLCQRRRERAE